MSSNVEIAARGPCDAYGDPDQRGGYVEIRIDTPTSEQRLRITRAAADALLLELEDVLSNAR
jgi:hypothetical protein